MGSKFIKQKHYVVKLLQNFETPRKRFSVILKLTKHMRERERERERESNNQFETLSLRIEREFIR